MKQLKISDIYNMPCPFNIGDKIYNHRFKQYGTIIRIYNEFFDYRLDGVEGVKGLRYSTAKDCILVGREEDKEKINRLKEEQEAFFRRINRQQTSFSMRI
jgi:hypothetical protein